MKSSINRFTFDLNPSEGVSSGLVLPGGEFSTNASRRVSGVMLVVGGGGDLSAIALLRCAFFHFRSRVFVGAIITCFTELEEKKSLFYYFVRFILYIHL